MKHPCLLRDCKNQPILGILFCPILNHEIRLEGCNNIRGARPKRAAEIIDRITEREKKINDRN